MTPESSFALKTKYSGGRKTLNLSDHFDDLIIVDQSVIEALPGLLERVDETLTKANDGTFTLPTMTKDRLETLLASVREVVDSTIDPSPTPASIEQTTFDPIRAVARAKETTEEWRKSLLAVKNELNGESTGDEMDLS